MNDLIPKGMKFTKSKNGAELCTIRAEIKFSRDELASIMYWLETNHREATLDGVRDLISEWTKKAMEDIEIKPWRL